MDPLAFVGGLIDTGANLWTSERNLDYAKRNLAWQKYVQQQTWQREDTAVQRRAADLKAAGFNPLLAAGGAASSGAAVQTTAPQSGFKSDFAEKIIAMQRAQADISMTRSQQELIKQNAENADKTNQLLQLQIDWYKNHPEYAPGAPSNTPEQRTSSWMNAGSNVLNSVKAFRDRNSNGGSYARRKLKEWFNYDLR